MLTLNLAGASQADPILAGLGLKLVGAGSSFDIATVNDAYIDAATGVGVTTVKAALTPAATVVTAGSAGTYNDTSKNWVMSSTTGLTAGDPIYLSHASITDGIYYIASVVDGTQYTVEDANGANPMDGAGNQTAIFYQVAWAWVGAGDAAPINHNAAGDQNFWKFQADDGAVGSTAEDSFWVADAPAGSAFINIESGDYSGQTVSDNLLTLAILAGWTNKGGISHVAMANHSVQAVNNFTWTTGGGTGEVALATAEGGLTASAGDGAKYGQLVFKAKAGSAYSVAVDIDVIVDSTGPVLVLTLVAA
jgi:hypothetical protein